MQKLQLQFGHRTCTENNKIPLQKDILYIYKYCMAYGLKGNLKILPCGSFSSQIAIRQQAFVKAITDILFLLFSYIRKLTVKKLILSHLNIRINTSIGAKTNYIQ